MKVRYHGHSCVELAGNDTSIVIDPFITGNSHAQVTVDQIKVDYIYITHGHGDHIGDAVQIAKNNDATIIAPFEIATYMSWQGLKTHPLHIGGSFKFDFGRVKATPALHGSALIDDAKKEIIYLGMPSGVIIELDSKKIYHAGDTGLFGDMKLIGEQQIDLAFLPIGDNFTMGPDDAIIAAEWIRAQKTVPIHYNTFPVIQQDPGQYVSSLLAKGLNAEVYTIGEWVVI